MMIIQPVVDPSFMRFIFKDFIWTSKTNKILLTFDDGPIPETTTAILKELNYHKIKTIFFCVGNNVKKNPGLVNEILSEGHQIGNHTYNHQNITGINKDEILLSIIEYNKYVEDKYGYKIKYFRPPHGRINLNSSSLIKTARLKNVMWSLLTYDYKNDINIVKFTVNKYLKKNSIIVLHDSLKSKDIIKDSMNIIFDKSLAKGFTIGEPSECLN